MAPFIVKLVQSLRLAFTVKGTIMQPKKKCIFLICDGEATL